MSTNLVSQERAKLATPNAASTDDRTIDALIAGVSRAIEKYCARTFGLASYDEFPEMFQPDGRIMLARFPVQSIEAVRHSPAIVAQVVNSLTATNQQARITVTSTGIELMRVASGVRTTNTLLFTSYATLASMMTAITALGNGWSGTVQGSASGDYGLWPSSDLWVSPWIGDAVRGTGALSCRGIAVPLYLHVGEANSYRWDARGWLEVVDNGLLPLALWSPFFGDAWSRQGQIGFNRIQYTAGYADIPDDVQEAAAAWVAALWWQSQRDPMLASLGGGGVSQTWSGQQTMPAVTRQLLAPYRTRRV